MILRQTAAALLFFFAAAAFSTLSAQRPGWQNLDPVSGTYGAAVDAMHDAAKGLKPSKKPVVVALIGYGADIGHGAVAGSVWKNPKEKANGKDDDRNGWVDDLHGWNLPGPVEQLSKEGDREYLRLRNKYENYFAVIGDKAYGYNNLTRRVVEVPMPKDMDEYNYFVRVKGESDIAQAYGGVKMAQAVVEYMKDADVRLREAFPGKKLTVDDFTALYDAAKAPEVERNLIAFTSLMTISSGSKEWDKMMEYATQNFVQYQMNGYIRALTIRLPRERETIGDDPYDINDRDYGSGVLLSGNAGFGTMQAGLVAGIAPGAKIMFLRVEAGARDESRVKDVALAIRYAVDKGAQIIQLGKGNTLYPPTGAWVDEALRYAGQKGVLVVAPVMDLSYDLAKVPFYPNRESAGLTNMITVAASDEYGNPMRAVNFGSKELDIFAPGVDVESAYPGNAKAVGSGSYLAAAMVTGTAAYIKSYYPKMTPQQLRELIISTVTPRSGVEVEKSFFLNGKLVSDLFLFDELSVSGGIMNAKQAFENAQKK